MQTTLKSTMTSTFPHHGRGMTPATTPALRHDPASLEAHAVAVLSLPADRISGDVQLFFASPHRPGCIHLAVGDVCGKGASAGQVARRIQNFLPLMDALDDRALSVLNEDLLKHTPGELFATLALAEIDAVAGTLRLWSAGHPPALLWRERERCVRETECGSVLLGCFPEWQGGAETWTWSDGDIVVLYSDGVTEVRDASGEFFGTERLASVLRDHAYESAATIAAALLAATRAWGSITDDVTILVCKREALIAAVADTEKRNGHMLHAFLLRPARVGMPLLSPVASTRTPHGAMRSPPRLQRMPLFHCSVAASKEIGVEQTPGTSDRRAGLDHSIANDSDTITDTSDSTRNDKPDDSNPGGYPDLTPTLAPPAMGGNYGTTRECLTFAYAPGTASWMAG
jgi:hypothetical protein